MVLQYDYCYSNFYIIGSNAGFVFYILRWRLNINGFSKAICCVLDNFDRNPGFLEEDVTELRPLKVHFAPLTIDVWKHLRSSNVKVVEDKL